MKQERPLLTALCWIGLLAMLAGCRTVPSSASVINTAVAGTMQALPTATATPLPPTPTLLPPPTIAVPAPRSNLPMVTARQRVSLRSGPGEAYPIYGVILVGTTAEVAGISPDGGWWVIKIPAGATSNSLAWLSAKYVDNANTKGVPVIPPPPTPAYVTPVAPQADGPAVVAAEALIVRAGPGMAYPDYGMVPAGTSLQAIGVSPDSQWWEVGLPVEVAANGQGWVSIFFVQAYRTTNLPVVEPPPFEVVILPPLPTSGKEAFALTTEAQAVRLGPGEDYTSYGRVAAGITATLVGVSPDGAWYAIRLPPEISTSQPGWIRAAKCRPFHAEGLPVLPLPPK